MEKLPHIGLTVGSVSPDTIVCGDPGRATRIAVHLDDAEMLGEWREYRSYRGTFNGLPVTVCSHGIGAPGAAIAFEELVAAGARRIIRVGTCGGLQPGIGSGDLVVATAAAQATGYGRYLVPDGYPAVADLDLTWALRQAAEADGRSASAGIVLTSDVFYPGISARRIDYAMMSQANVLAVEMECSALFVFGSLRGVSTGAILAVDGNVLEDGEEMESFNPHRDVVRTAVDAATIAALQALHRMAENNEKSS
ncbi:MAG: nucleoside phosphorylase [Chloroflexi bacterium]|nr:nucleoside phosphorylase [Chloroflexota bacterium]